MCAKYQHVWSVQFRVIFGCARGMFVVPRTSLRHGTKKRNTILCSTSKIFCRNSFHDTASIRHLVHYTYTRWKRFKDGRESLGDDERRPPTAVHDENVAKARCCSDNLVSSLRVVAEELVRRVRRIRPEYRDPGSRTLL